MQKKADDMSAVELILDDLNKSVDRLEEKLKKIEALADDAWLKASMSHSLIVVRKIGEDRLEEFKDLLD